MIKVIQFSSFGRERKGMASKQLEEYLFDNCIRREQIITITSNQAQNNSTGDTVMLVYEK